MREYHKIEGLFKRDELTKKLLPDEFRNEVVEMLKNCDWQFTEKIDGTNVRVVWDGHSVSFYGRTDRAELPKGLLESLEVAFGGEVNEQIFEEHFGDAEVILYGEGYGAKIQKVGGDYRSDNAFILFDVQIGDLFLTRENVESVATYFGVEVVPIVLTGTIEDAIKFVRSRPDSTIGVAKMEGVVGRPRVELRDRRGKRVIVKIKVRDMEELGERIPEETGDISVDDMRTKLKKYCNSRFCNYYTENQCPIIDYTCMFREMSDDEIRDAYRIAILKK